VKIRRLKDDNGKDIPGTLALLPEVIEAVRTLKIETIGTVRWLATQTHDFQRDYLDKVKRKGVKPAQRKRQKFGPKTKLEVAAQAFDELSGEEKFKHRTMVNDWCEQHPNEGGGSS
jgi:hypothetical protein